MRSNTPTSFAPSHKCTVRTLHGSPPSTAYMRALDGKSRIRSRMLRIRRANYNNKATIQKQTLPIVNNYHCRFLMRRTAYMDKVDFQFFGTWIKHTLQQASNCSVVVPSIQLKQTNVVGQHLYTSHSQFATQSWKGTVANETQLLRKVCAGMPLLHSNLQVLLPNCCVDFAPAHGEKACDACWLGISCSSPRCLFCCFCIRYSSMPVPGSSTELRT